MVCFSFGVFTVRLIFLVGSWPSAILEQRDDSLLHARSELGGVLSLIECKRLFYGTQPKSIPRKCAAVICDFSCECEIYTSVIQLKLCGSMLYKRCRVPYHQVFVRQTWIRISSRYWLCSHSLFPSFVCITVWNAVRHSFGDCKNIKPLCTLHFGQYYIITKHTHSNLYFHHTVEYN